MLNAFTKKPGADFINGCTKKGPQGSGIVIHRNISDPSVPGTQPNSKRAHYATLGQEMQKRHSIT